MASQLSRSLIIEADGDHSSAAHQLEEVEARVVNCMIKLDGLNFEALSQEPRPKERGF